MKLYVVFLLLLVNANSFSQDITMNKEVKEIVKLGKDAIVKMALGMIDEDVSAQNFSRIKVMTNGETVQVSFRNPIKYLPVNSVFYSDFGVDVLKNVISYAKVSNENFNADDKISPYYKTEEMENTIQFVIESINSSDNVGSIDIASFEDDMTIRESKDYYDILVVSEFQESTYKIDKESGNVFDVNHAKLMSSPTFDNGQEKEFVEVN
ncbi:hypothetical protein [Maribacter litoralis]|uniref:Uncharacterized protein n=1 Tax=Maribacter litoralis TaxID=2059726 RepID=A0A653S673_9FLAO|nr:hypothetical protein [Maribacter litoralis]VXB62273.1 conserved exported hypothetical protein [Maribacter litoralis]